MTGVQTCALPISFSHLDAELHGLTVWALTALVSAIMLGQLVSAAISTASQGIGSVTTAPTSDTSLPAVLGGQNLIDRLQQSLSTGGDPTRMSRDQITAEISLLITRRLVNGSLAPAERDRLIALITQRDGVGRDEAALRITRM